MYSSRYSATLYYIIKGRDKHKYVYFINGSLNLSNPFLFIGMERRLKITLYVPC